LWEACMCGSQSSSCGENNIIRLNAGYSSKNFQGHPSLKIIQTDTALKENGNRQSI